MSDENSPQRDHDRWSDNHEISNADASDENISIWNWIKQIWDEIPVNDLEKIPIDGAARHD